MDPLTAVAKKKAEEADVSHSTPLAPPRGKHQRIRRRSSISTLSDDYVASFFSGPDTTDEDALNRREVQDAISDGNKIKASWVSHQLKTRLNEYTFNSDITVCAGTFNVNGRKPVDTAADGSSVSVSLDDWLVQNLVDEPDVYAIGFQELDLSKENFLLNNSSYEDMWTPVIENSISQKTTYTKLVSKQLVGMLIIIYVKECHVAHTSELAASSEGTGIMGMMGNKGGVSVRFKLHATSFCFVCSHLAAHNKNVLRRNRDWSEILRRTVLTTSSPDHGSHDNRILDHDVVVVMGDFNYRIPDRDALEVIDLVHKKQYESLLSIDQLHVEKAAGNVFVGFDEAIITFPPTYKYEPGTDDFETKKLRTPSWCDRVLFKGTSIHAIQYTSCPECKLSDHKPVRALFRCGILEIDAAKYADVLQSVHRNLDLLENEAMPDAVVSKHQFDFGEVHFGNRHSTKFTITNTGKVMFSFRFTNKPEEDRYAPLWLTLEPTAGIIAPGDSLDVRMECFVDNAMAGDMNSGAMEFDDIIVLHLENGKDFFLSVVGTWRRTCMCTPLAQLVQQTAPYATIAIGADSTPHAASVSGADAQPIPTSVKALKVPKEVWKMVNHLVLFGKEETSLFFAGPSLDNMQRVVGFLDTDAAIPDGFDVHSVAEALIMILRYLPQPVVPSEFHKSCLDARTSYLGSRQVINMLPPPHQYMFLYITAFLRELLDVFTCGFTDVDDAMQLKEELREKYALLFGTLLMRPPKKKRLSPSVAKKQAQFVELFLSNPDIAD